MLVSETRVKRKKNKKRPAQREKMFLYYTMRWVKHSSQLRFSHVLLAFYSRFTRVLLAFLFTNANQKHSVIGASVPTVHVEGFHTGCPCFFEEYKHVTYKYTVRPSFHLEKSKGNIVI